MRVVYAFVVIFLSLLIGTAIGDIVYLFLPPYTFVSTLLSTSIAPSWHLEGLDLSVLTLGLFLQIKITVTSLLGMIAGTVVSLRKI